MEENTVLWIGQTLLYIILFFLLFIISKQFFRFRFRKIDINNELSVKDNVSFSIVTVGYFVGIATIFFGVIQGESYGYLNDIVLVVGYGVLGNILLIIASMVNEKIIFNKKFNLYKEVIKDENKGTGCIEAANFIAASFIIYGAIQGKSINIFPQLENIGLHLSGFISLLILWSIGQIVLFLFLRLYTTVSKYDIFLELEKDNNAIGIVYASILIAISYLYSQSIAGDMVSWYLTLENSGYYLGLGLILLPISRWIVDKVILPKSNLTHEILNQDIPNQGAAFIEAFAYVGSAILISYCI